MAGNVDKIDELVDLPLVEQQLLTTKKLSADLTKQFIDNLKAANDLNAAIGKASNNSQFNKSQEQAALATEKLRLAQIKSEEALQKVALAQARVQAAIDRNTQAQQRAENQILKTQQAQERAASKEQENYNKNLILLGRQEAAREAARNKEEAANARQAALTAKQAQAYNVLNAAYQEATTLARNAGAQWGENSVQFQNAAKSANFLRERLDAIDKPLGNYQRNVGNYASGFNGLQNSINQLTREFPAFTYSIQTGFLALSNNLPIFFDQISQTRAEITRLRAAGEQVPGLFTQLARSIFSFGTFLSVGVTLLTVYGKEIGNFVGALFKGKAGMDEFTERQKILNQALKSTDYKNAIQNIFELRSEIKLAKDGFISKDGVVNHYNETIGKTTGLVDNLDQAERGLNANAENYIKYTFLKAAANLALQDAAEAAYQTELDRIENEKKLQRLAQSPQYNNANSDAAGAILGTAAAMRDKNIREEGKKQVKTFTDIANDFLKQAAQFQFNFFDNNKKVVTEATKTVNTAVEDELRALEYQYEQQIELARALDKENLALAEEYIKQIEEARKAAEERAINGAKLSASERLLVADQERQKMLEIIAEQYEKGIISKAGYEQKKADIEYSYGVESVQNAIDLAQELIDIKKSQGKDTTNDEIELAKLQIKLSEQVTAKKLSDLDKQMARQKEINAAVKNLAEEAANFVIALVDAGFTNRKNQLRAEQDQLEERTSQEIAAVDRSLGTEQEKADKIAVIRAKEQSEKDKIAKQQRAIDVEKAKFDKAVAIARIIENTAIGITSALAQFPPNVPLSILIGALGAVQLGTVLAQPIPAYAKGTKNAKGGLSIVGEQGRELIETPSGKSFLSPDTATMLNLPSGSKVTPHHETMRMIGRPENLAGYKDREEVPWREVISAIKEQKQVKNNNKINVNVDAGFYIYRENHFR